MSDQPLFKKVDEQEGELAPQQLADDSARKRAAELEDGARDTDVDGIGVPAAGAGLMGQVGSGASTSVAGGAPGAIGPVVAASADEDETTGDRPV
ncbi:MAG: hypothetical protein M3R24_42375 [Chloroflexota bacterium]|nr:hypothetical protein [Chloroflexota bacterium]